VTTFKLTLAYDGTDFVGWQRQASGRSVQALLEEALSPIEGASVAVIGAGRTDAGVHALGQVASVSLTRTIGARELRRALNATLPPDVRVLAAETAPEGFNARYAAHSKSYRYHIICDETISPFDRQFAWHVPAPLDVSAMRRAAHCLRGRHDFSAFQSAGSSVASAVREIMLSQLSAEPVSETALKIVYDVTADGFLRHMIRASVGTLVEIGAGRLKPDAIDEILASRDRQRAGPTAPARGLFLTGVYYAAGVAATRSHGGADEELA
jgi:tRNA pseudouridine38-40 synthase